MENGGFRRWRQRIEVVGFRGIQVTVRFRFRFLARCEVRDARCEKREMREEGREGRKRVEGSAVPEECLGRHCPERGAQSPFPADSSKHRPLPSTKHQAPSTRHKPFLLPIHIFLLLPPHPRRTPPSPYYCTFQSFAPCCCRPPRCFCC